MSWESNPEPSAKVGARFGSDFVFSPLFPLARRGGFATACYMASTYLRPRSPFIWLRMKDAEGKWVSRATQYRKDNPGDRRQAELLARKFGLEERERAPRSAAGAWDEWVEGFIADRYGEAQTGTKAQSLRRWRRLRAWLAGAQIGTPRQMTYALALEYKTARAAQGVGINTIIGELKFMALVMSEAIRRGYAVANPCAKMGLKRAPAREKSVWTLDEARTVAQAVRSAPLWMQATFVLGYYQAARLRQCEVPLADIQLKKLRITYWRTLGGRPLMKGDKPFTQPLDPAAAAWLGTIIATRRAEGHRDLCSIPLLASVEWRRFLDGLGLHHLCHHGLRATWITRAASSGAISLAQAKRFVNHGSTAVHQIYQRLCADDIAHVPAALHLPEL